MSSRAPGRLARFVKRSFKALALALGGILGAYGIIYGFLMLVPRSPDEPTALPPGSFAFAALGDAPYSAVEFTLFDVVLEDIAAHELTSVIHVGDIFQEPCRDEAYRRTLDQFNGIPHPVVYTPGDNEWTDCYDGSEASNPFRRLASIRSVFFSEPSRSLGGRRIPLRHQGEDPEHGEFPENARWVQLGVVFATLHLVGTWNGTRPFAGRTELEENEPARRTEAAAAWVRETFVLAEEVGATAVVLAFHASPYFERSPDTRQRSVFEPFLVTLEEEVAAFEKPVLGIHGDFHEFIVDRPLVDRRTGETLDNFTRMQVPGSPSVGWVHITVTPTGQELFRFEPRIVGYWPL